MREAQRESGQRGYDGLCRTLTPDVVAANQAAGVPYVVRFRSPVVGETTFHDAIRGDITFANEQIDDTVLLKSDGFPTYHLANVVDDHFMEITHILRADEWINTAPLHVQLYDAFGWQMPTIAHLPVVLSPSGKGKLSKRDQAFQDDGMTVLVQVREFVEAGYPAEAVINFLTNVGWSFGDDVEMYTSEQALPRFELDAINPSPTKLPYPKLEWLSGQYIQEMDTVALAQRVKPYLEAAGHEVNLEALLQVMPAMKVRLKKFTDAEPFLLFLLEPELWHVPVERLTHKKMGPAAALHGFTEARALVASAETLALDALSDGLYAIGEQVTENHKAGPFLGTLRFAITGQQVSPPLFESILALGQSETLRRLDAIIEMLSDSAESTASA
jgi:glutamyl-tRNA synthetase